MNASQWIVRGVLGWVALVTTAHLSLNFDWSAILNEYRTESERRLNVAYIPVT